MSLSLRLTLAFSALLALLGIAAGFGLHALTAEMRDALGETASELGHSLLTVFHRKQVDGSTTTAETMQWVHKEVIEIEQSEPLPAPAAAGAVADIDLDVTSPEGTAATQLRVVVNGRELSAEEIAALPAQSMPGLAAEAATQGPLKIELTRGASGERPALLVRGLESGGALIPISGLRSEAAIDRFAQRMLWGLLALLLIGAVLAAALARRISAPMRALGEAALRLGRGESVPPLADRGPPELRATLQAFNRMRDDLQRLQAEAEAAQADRELAELGEIGRGLAHSLRNPLHALGLSLDALSSGSDAERGAELARSGRDQLARIDQALRGFLALSASSGANVEPVELDEVIDDVLLEASQRAQGRVQLQRERCGLTLPAVTAELRILLHALLINALEASPDGATVSVRAAAGATPGSVLIEIEDAGPGLSATIRSRLFQPHVSSKPAGAGMGLYLAERLARLRYHGRLQLLDRSPHGTLARLELQPREVRRA